jgi:hypothetical protein
MKPHRLEAYATKLVTAAQLKFLHKLDLPILSGGRDWHLAAAIDTLFLEVSHQ